MLVDNPSKLQLLHCGLLYSYHHCQLLPVAIVLNYLFLIYKKKLSVRVCVDWRHVCMPTEVMFVDWRHYKDWAVCVMKLFVDWRHVCQLMKLHPGTPRHKWRPGQREYKWRPGTSKRNYRLGHPDTTHDRDTGNINDDRDTGTQL